MTIICAATTSKDVEIEIGIKDRKYYVEGVEMTAEEFNDFLRSREAYKAKLRRSSVEELEAEFEEKTEYLRYTDVFD